LLGIQHFSSVVWLAVCRYAVVASQSTE